MSPTNRKLALLLVLSLPLAALAVPVMPSARAAGEELTYEVFDVSDITRPRPAVVGPFLGIDSPTWMAERARPETDEPRPFLEIDQLVELLRDTVYPESWENLDGVEISARGTWLGVRNRPAAVRKVGEALEVIRAQANRRVLLSVRVRDDAGDAYPAAAATARLGASGSLEAPLGVRRALAATNTVHYVSEYEVEIAQGSTISNPVVRTGLEGLVADLIALPTLDGNRVLLEAVLQQGSFGEPRTHRLPIDEEYFAEPFRSEERSHLGVLELPVFEGVSAHVSAVVPSGGTVTIPVASRNGQRTLEVRAELLGASPSPDLIRLGALSRRPFGVYVGLPPERGQYDDWMAPKLRYEDREWAPPWGSAEEVIEAVLYNVAPEYWEAGMGGLSLIDGDRVRVEARADVRDQVLAFLAKREAEALRPLAVDLQIWSVPEGEIEVGPGKRIVAEDALRVHGARIPTISGRVASLLAGSTADYLVDYDVEVAQEARISDPITAQSFDGLMVNLRPDLSPAGDAVALALELQVANRTIRTEPFETGAQFLGPIDKVEVARTGADTTIHVPLRGAYVLDLGRDPTRPGRRLAAEIRVEPR